jgi:hypothetical protein
MLYLKSASSTPEGVTQIEVGPRSKDTLLAAVSAGGIIMSTSSIFLRTPNITPSNLIDDGVEADIIAQLTDKSEGIDDGFYHPVEDFKPSIKMPDGSFQGIVQFRVLG